MEVGDSSQALLESLVQPGEQSPPVKGAKDRPRSNASATHKGEHMARIIRGILHQIEILLRAWTVVWTSQVV